MTKKQLQSTEGSFRGSHRHHPHKIYAPKPSAKFAHVNHHHELTEDHEIVSMGGETFVANVQAIPLLQALNDLGLQTRTHHVDKDGGFVSILISPLVSVEIRTVNEIHTERKRYNGRAEVLIQWRKESGHG